MDVGMRAKIAFAEEQLEHTIGKFGRHATHSADDKIAVCGTAKPDRLLNLRVCLVDRHA